MYGIILQRMFGCQGMGEIRMRRKRWGKARWKAANGRKRTGQRRRNAVKTECLVMTGGVLLLLTLVLQALARLVPGFAEWYATSVYTWIVGIVGRICGIFPFSVVEIGLYVVVFGGIWYVASHLKEWKRMLAVLFSFSSLLLFLYTVNCGINYYRVPFSRYLDLDVRESSKEELAELCQELVLRVNEAAARVEASNAPDGVAMKAEQTQEGTDLSYLDQLEMAKIGQAAMVRMGKEYEQLGGFYPRPKPVLVSWILSVQQLSGIYSPFTVEANYNWKMTGYNIPHTVCHELSHLKGFMREDEANFIGYLACIGSDDAFFQYSGYLTGWVYAGNALAGQDWEQFALLHDQLCPQAIADLQANNVFWDRYEGEIAEAANQVNDTYLKINSQEDGVKSYGRMVDLMLAYRRR